jgi:benzodiazapine receptor
MTHPPLWKPALVAVLATTAVVGVGGWLTEIGPWYENLAKPAWQPPRWMFPVGWTVIFTLTAIAGVLAWRSAPDNRARRRLIVLLAVNAALNMLWSALFFRLQRPDLAFYEVVPLWLSILAITVVVARWSKPAAALLLPYLAWVLFAGTLNYTVARMNGML